MNLGAKIAAFLVGVINASFIAVVAHELVGLAAGVTAGLLTFALEAWAFARVRTLMTPPQVGNAPQETQA
jgi:hypothetical protein